ncbi:hypothetical protein Pint_26069 [Pistacia integerrima]|uniref:Uncharacterized protein n=1 Tax=Pistacia integerrima TaxID=434235 RepID=A0ACC0YAH9_9ROSI|nr:hypothetical protein Pint_26069 [Pistacia integerrima]
MKSVEMVVRKAVKSIIGLPVGNRKCVLKRLKIKIKCVNQKSMRNSFCRLSSELDEIEEDVKTKLETNDKEVEISKKMCRSETWLSEVERMKGDVEDLKSEYQKNSNQLMMCGVCPSPDMLKLYRRVMKITGNIQKLKSQVSQKFVMSPTRSKNLNQQEGEAETKGEIEEISETMQQAAVAKSFMAVDQVNASRMGSVTEDEKMLPPEPDAVPIKESEIQLICSETMHPNEEMRYEALTSQSERSRMKPGVTESVKQSAVEPVVPKTAMKSGSSIITTEDQFLLESGLDVNDSIMRTMRKIFRYMSDVTATKIGVHGIGGIGKTTVLKALTGCPRIKSIFCVIILMSVSRYWSTRKIQNEVLKQLSLCCEDSETDSQVAEKLFQVLKGKKFLLLLDDVWEHIDLQAVGIPDPNIENGCKIIMASRKVDVLRSMDATGVIEVETVSGEEAWKLFHEQVGGIIDLPAIQPLAQAIVEGCGGLPLLIIVTGRALADETNISVWKHASWKFSLPGTTRVFQIEDVIGLLQFSFDQLKDHEMKSCFLFCALFSEDLEIDVFEFVEYCIQEGIICGTLADAHKRGYDTVDVLVRASLLQVSEGGDSIRMHDLIRDLALGILASATGDTQFLLRAYSRLKELSNPGSSPSFRSLSCPESTGLSIPETHHFLLRGGAGLTEPPSEEEWRQAKMIFLMDNDLRTLPEKPNCPELFILFLQRNSKLRAIPASFFDLMTSLKVLNLSRNSIRSLPKTLFKLINLEILILRYCERLAVLPSDVGFLESLEVLDLHGTEIIKLPDEIGKLASLRHLEVSLYGSINYTEYVKLPQKLISSGIISKLHKLENLSIGVYPGDQRWYKDVKSLIIEVSNNLKDLSSLSCHFPEVETLQLFLQTSRAWKTQRLSEFKFVVGPDVKSIISRVPHYIKFDYHQHGQCLRFVNSEKIPEAVLEVLARSTAFYLDHHLGVRNLSEFGVSNINRLKFCIISECPNIETFLESNELTETVFPILENFSMHYMWNLTSLWEGIVPAGSFAELRILTVHACPKLKYVFSRFTSEFMPKLEELTVEDCPDVEEIMLEDENIIDCDQIALPRLKKLKLHYLPGLVNIWRSGWPSLELISFYDCPRLKKITGKDSKLKHRKMEIQAEESWWNALEWEDPELQLHLQNCFTNISEDEL